VMRGVFIAIIIAILIVFAQENLPAQQERIDSMERALDTAGAKSRINILIKLTLQYRDIDPSKGIEYGQKALEHLQEPGDRKSEAECLMYIGVCYYNLNDLDHSMECYFKSMKIREELNDREGIAAILNNLGSISKEMGNYDKAIEYYRQTRQLGEELGNKKVICAALANLAVCYRLLNELDTALDYNLQALAIREEIGDRRGIGSSLNNIAVIYADSAFHDRDINKALDYFERALKIKEEFDDQVGICQTLINIGQLRTELKQFSQAKIYLEKGLEISKNLGVTNLVIVAYAHLADYYEKCRDFSNAYKYQVRYTILMDSVYIEDNKQQIAEMQVRYETEKKEQENELLRQQSEIQSLQIIRQRNQRNSFIILAVLMLGLALAVYSRYELKRRTNKLLEEKNSQLAILNATKDKFFHIISHDLKNPFSSLLQVSQHLEERFSVLNDEQKLQIISLISKSSVQTHSLLANLLEWSVSQSGNVPAKIEEIDLHEMIENTIEFSKLSAEKKEITLVSEVMPRILVSADRNMVSTVLRNLLSNAIKFTNGPGEVRLSSKDRGEFIEVRVKDSGIGISEKDLGKLFRIDVNSKEIGRSKEKGTGLGLVLCREFVEKNGGVIWAESTLEAGSTFVFTLPKVRNTRL
jgi:signal transduction histidine kinase/Tfp pilus assembly protein PilF